MKNLYKVVILVLLLITLVNLLALPAMAMSMYTDELEIIIEMDKEAYEVGESISAAITVGNIHEIPVTVTNIEQLVPEGYYLDPDSESILSEITLEPGEYITLIVTLIAEEVPEAEAEPDFLTILLEGETWGIRNWILAILAILAVALFMILT